MPDPAAIDLRPYFAGIPPKMDRETLHALTPEQQAALVRTLETNAARLRDAVIRSEEASAQRVKEEAELLRAAQEEEGVSSIEELEERLAAADEEVLACFAAVDALLSASPA